MGHLDGYAGQLSYGHGDTVQLHLSSSSTDVAVRVARVGGAVDVVAEIVVEVGDHPAPSDADSRGCRWPVAATLQVDDAWRSGFYEVELSCEGAATAYAYFVLRSPAARSTAPPPLLVVATNTYNAYNNWGGRSLYTGGTHVSFRRPFGPGAVRRDPVERDDRKARPRHRREQPDVDGRAYEAYRAEHGYPAWIGSTGWWTFERRFAEWAERSGNALDYAISSDLELHPEVVEGRRLLVSVGHDEYWSAGMRDTLDSFLESGGNLASFSGNTIFWQVRYDGPADDPAAHMVCHKYSAHDTDPVMSDPDADRRTMTGIWSDPLLDRPEASTLGAASAWGMYSRFGGASAWSSGGFTVYRPEHWIFEGTGLGYGDVLGADDGVVGYENVGCRIQFDDYQLPVRMGGDHTPENNEIVALCPVSNLMQGEYPASTSAPGDQSDLDFIASRIFGRVDDDSIKRMRHGNAVIATHDQHGGPHGGTVVTVGSTDWVFGLADDEIVGRVTANIIGRLNASD